MRQPVRVAYLVSHPIQYQAPLLRYIARQPEIDLTVLFGSDFSIRGYRDEGFGVEVTWDVPLLEGYRHEFLPPLRDRGTQSITSPISRGIFRRLRGPGDGPAFDLLWVHGYGTVNAMQGMLTAKLLDIPVVVRAESWLRDRERSRVKLAMKRLFFAGLEQLVAGVLCIGSCNRDYWRFYFGDRVPLFDMPYAVDNDYFQTKSVEAVSSRAALIQELRLERGRKVILFAAKLQERKHCDHLLEAYKRLLAEPGEGSPPYLVIVGDGEARPRLEAAALGMEGVRFCGFRNQSELPRFFDLATVFVLPARHEPWGLIVNEVMNASRPVILSDGVGCHRDLVTHGVEGLIYPVGDIAALTDALRQIVQVPGLAEPMGQAAKAKIAGWGFEQDVAGLREAIECLTAAAP